MLQSNGTKKRCALNWDKKLSRDDFFEYGLFAADLYRLFIKKKVRVNKHESVLFFRQSRADLAQKLR